MCGAVGYGLTQIPGVQQGVKGLVHVPYEVRDTQLRGFLDFLFKRGERYELEFSEFSR